MSFIGFAVSSIIGQQIGGGIHMWDIRLRAFFRILYVRTAPITQATLEADGVRSGSISPLSPTQSL